MDWQTFLRVMIEDEKAAMAKYKIAFEMADSDTLKEVLRRLMGEEQIHVDYLEEEIRRLGST